MSRLSYCLLQEEQCRYPRLPFGYRVLEIFHWQSFYGFCLDSLRLNDVPMMAFIELLIQFRLLLTQLRSRSGSLIAPCNSERSDIIPRSASTPDPWKWRGAATTAFLDLDLSFENTQSYALTTDLLVSSASLLSFIFLLAHP